MNGYSSTLIHERPAPYEVPTAPSTATIGSPAIEQWLIPAPGSPRNPRRVETRIGSEATGESQTIPQFRFEPTSDQNEMRHILDIIEAAARGGNERIAGLLLNSIPWEGRPAEELVRAIRAALEAGLHPIAWKLAALAAKRFPEHAEVQKIARILSPARVIKTHLPPDPDAGADIKWLKEHGHEYRGQWVALKGGKLLAVGSTLKELTAVVGNVKGTGILITVVY